MASVRQESILDPLLFLIYINDLPNESKSNVNLFADDTYFFTIVKDKSENDNTLNTNLMLISKWAYDWKMLFNPDPVNLPRKKQVQIHPTISLNNIQVERALYQKHLGFILDEILNFKQHNVSAISKVSKSISLIKKNQ